MSFSSFARHTFRRAPFRHLWTFTVGAWLVLLAASSARAQLVWHDLAYDTTPPIANPYKGFMDYSAGELPGSEEFPHSLEFFYIGMDEFYDDTPMPVALETPDFSALEFELDDIMSRGRQAVFRIFIDFPEPLEGANCPTYANQTAVEAAAMASSNFALPEFLYASADVTDYCTLGDSFGFQPDYTSNALLTEIEDLMAAMDAEYDSNPLNNFENDPRIAYIQVGFVGHWGEWHTFLDTSDPLDCDLAADFMVHDAMDRVLNVFDATEGNFTQTRVVVSADLLQCLLHFDGNEAATAGVSFLRSIGIHDDDFANSTVCETFGYQTRAEFWGLDEDWRSLPIGGEVQPSIQELIHADEDTFDCGDDPDDYDTGELDDAVAAVHSSWLLNYNLFEPPTGSTPPMQTVNAEATSRTMGYQLFVSQVALPAEVADTASLDIALRIENRGTAPLAYNMNVDLVVLDGPTEVASFPLDGDVFLMDVIDLTPADFTAEIDGHGLAAGAYDLALRVPNSMAGGMALQFANVEQVGDLLMLGSVEVVAAGIFADGFETGSTGAWSSATP